MSQLVFKSSKTHLALWFLSSYSIVYYGVIKPSLPFQLTQIYNDCRIIKRQCGYEEDIIGILFRAASLTYAFDSVPHTHSAFGEECEKRAKESEKKKFSGMK